ncbi:sulfurtransferase [Peptostreptococcus russellii]|uniref:sulfurtransferase n=1 Tax=Peptostreptococcus russellii TaxID=215200 RepID=UPI00294394B6|nr:sulfurtransferase [Peptostreptococcus russellii]
MKIISKKIIYPILSAFLVFSAVGCNKEDTSKEAAPQKTESSSEEATTKDLYTFDNNDYFTSVDWLKKNMGKDVIILDARSDKDYAKGHIPGAINVAWQSLSKVSGKPGDKDWGTLLDPKELSAEFRKLGIKKDSKVVVYGNKSAWGEDGRLVWSLKRAGIDARILNGGYDLWTADKLETTKAVPKPEESDLLLTAVSPDANITTEELKKDYDQYKIIDVREKEEYDGATKYGEARGGHLPNAINITFNQLYNEDGTIKSSKEIEKILEKAGIKKDDRIVTYCTAGIRSAHMTLALENAGYKNVQNYDASFYEWAGDEVNKLEKK